MPLLSRVERRSIGGRSLLTLAYLLLIVGSIATVYPFLLMLSASVASSADAGELQVIPRYLYSDTALFAKYVDEKYQGDMDLIAARFGYPLTSVKELRLPPPVDPDILAKWRAFERTLPLSWRQAGFRGYATHPGPLRRAYQQAMQKQFAGNIVRYDTAYTEQAKDFLFVTPPLERPNSRLWVAEDSSKMRDFVQWKATLPEDWLFTVGMEPVWARYLREEAYNSDLMAARAVWGADVKAFTAIPLSFAPPENPAQRRDWERFVRTHLPLRHIAITPSDRAQVTTLFAEYLRRKYHGSLTRLNDAYRTDGISYPSFDRISLPDAETVRGLPRLDWSEFLATDAPLAFLRADTPENRYRLAFGTTGLPPYEADDAAFVRSHAASLRMHYLWRNYGIVLDYILLHGRAIWVTILFCGASVLAALIVNPFCAYALSRFDLQRGYQIVLFLLATMAFPAEITMIPSFLMLKEMGMLNTFWALVLPGMANGYAVFLLKGFFDSLPRELYEAGMIDGAGETTLLLRITFPMSGPILAVIALNAFLSAYGAFMFALVVCQDSRMWTIMVWLYQLQASSPKYIVMAALTVAAVPTLLVFLFAQKVILRGVLIPVEK